jgi:hypothetical protein
MRLPVKWSDNFLGPEDTVDLLSFIKSLSFHHMDVMDDWVKNPYADVGKIKNTIALLTDLAILSVDSRGNTQLANIQDIGEGVAELETFFGCVFLRSKKELLFELIPFDRLTYSEQSGRYGFFRNHSPLAYSGVLNLLISFKILTSVNIHFVEITSKKFESLIVKKVEESLKGMGDITPEALKRLIDARQIIGERSEVEALKYELSRLAGLGVGGRPLRVSLLDVSRGYDILSYEHADSMAYDRFIEVKTFNSATFYLSKNELMKAKELGSSYFIYLVKHDQAGAAFIEVIKNPALEFEGDGWGLEPNEYIVRRQG